MDSTKAFTVHPGMAVIIADMGLSPGNVLRRAGLAADLFSRGTVAVPTEQYFALWHALEAEGKEIEVPLRFAEVVSLEVFDAPIFAAMCSPNLRLAAHRLAEYKRLIGPVRLSVMDTRRGVELEYVWPERLQPPRALAAGELVFWVALARLATRVEVRPIEITTPWLPPNPDAYRRYFGVPLREADAQRIVFSSREAELPFVTENEGLWDFFEPRLQQRLTELEVGASVAERVRGALLELLPSGSPSMEAVARALAVSTRTLQRRLRGEGTTFQEVLGVTRESLARHYLTRSGLTTSEISFLLGYEEPNSFYRAFRSWTGETPEAVRANAPS